MSFCIVYLASPKSFHIYDNPAMTSRLDLLKSSLGLTRKLFPTTDVYVFHEDYDMPEMEQLPGVKEFIKVDFSGKESVVNKSLRRPYGYLMMCRFFSGVMQTYPQLQKYTHYMRLDDDSFFLEPNLSESYVISTLLKHDYVFRSLFHDTQDQQSLFEFTLDFLRKEGYNDAVISILKTELQKRYFLSGNAYTGIAPYNNFHIASRRLWENPLVRRYIDAIEASNGILQKGWMDANIHSMIIYVLSLFIGMKIHHDATFGYRHNVHISVLNSSGIVYNKDIPFGLE